MGNGGTFYRFAKHSDIMRWENCLKHPKSSFVIYLVVFLDTR